MKSFLNGAGFGLVLIGLVLVARGIYNAHTLVCEMNAMACAWTAIVIGVSLAIAGYEVRRVSRRA